MLFANGDAGEHEAEDGNGETRRRPPSSETLAEEFQRSISMAGPPTTLLELAGKIERVQPVGVWIDPRVDPRQPLAPSPRSLPLRAFLDHATAQTTAAARSLGGTLLLVPADDDRLVSLAYSQQRAGDERDRFDLTWDDAITPRELLELLRAERTLAFDAIDAAALPDDLWRAGSWFDVTDSEAAALLLVPCGLGFEWEGPTLRLAPLRDRYEFDRTYRSRSFPGGRESLQIAHDRALKIDATQVTRVTGGLTFRGTAAEHDRLVAATRQQEQAAEIDWSRERFTLTLRRAPLGSVLNLIDDRGLPIAYDRDAIAAAVPLTRPIDLEVVTVDVAGLTAAIAEAAGLQSEGDATAARLFVADDAR